MALDLAGEVVGVVAYRGEGSTCYITAVVVRPDKRGLGLGSEGVRLLEEYCASRGIVTFYAQVPLDGGLAFYFWLRLGYRPLGVVEGSMLMGRQERRE